MDNQDKYEILAKLIAIFGEKKWLLSKFLIDNGAINETFLKKVDLPKINDMQNFKDIGSLNNYLEKIVDVATRNKEVDLGQKLQQLLEDEKYEEAAKLRDWLAKMKRK